MAYIDILDNIKEMYGHDIVIPTSEENALLCQRYQNGDKKAGDELVYRNALFIIKMINIKFPYLEEDDCFIEGSMALLRAAKDYSKDKGSFTTYASFWIWQSIGRNIAQKNEVVRMPTFIHGALFKLRKLYNEYPEHELTSEFCAQELGLSIKSIEALLPYVKGIRRMEEKIEKADGDSNTELGMMIPDKNAYFEEKVCNKCLNEKFARLREEILSPKENTVLNMRLGFNRENKIYTLEEVGNTLTPSITKERVRQIQKNAIKKLQKSQKIKQLLSEYA